MVEYKSTISRKVKDCCWICRNVAQPGFSNDAKQMLFHNTMCGRNQINEVKQKQLCGVINLDEGQSEGELDEKLTVSWSCVEHRNKTPDVHPASVSSITGRGFSSWQLFPDVLGLLIVALIHKNVEEGSAFILKLKNVQHHQHRTGRNQCFSFSSLLRSGSVDVEDLQPKSLLQPGNYVKRLFIETLAEHWQLVPMNGGVYRLNSWL